MDVDGRGDRPGDATALARSAFGWSALRDVQRRALEPVLAGRDTLAVLATGSGKSAVYQLAGLLSGGLTVVVSPLVALQRDQLRGLAGRTLPDGRPVRAAQLNSAEHVAEQDDAAAAVRAGDLDFLLLGPGSSAARPLSSCWRAPDAPATCSSSTRPT